MNRSYAINLRWPLGSGRFVTIKLFAVALPLSRLVWK